MFREEGSENAGHERGIFVKKSRAVSLYTLLKSIKKNTKPVTFDWLEDQVKSAYTTAGDLIIGELYGKDITYSKDDFYHWETHLALTLDNIIYIADKHEADKKRYDDTYTKDGTYLAALVKDIEKKADKEIRTIVMNSGRLHSVTFVKVKQFLVKKSNSMKGAEIKDA